MHKQTKILLGIILLLGIVFAVVLINGNNQTPTAITNQISVPNEKLSEAPIQEIIQPETKELKDTTPLVTETLIEFKDIEYSLTSDGFNFKGKLYSENTNVDGLIIKLFCNDKEVVNTLIRSNEVTLSDKEGNFEITSKCVPNDLAYAQLVYGESTFESTHLIVPHGRFGHHRTASILSSPAAGVPEYSTITIGFAVITVLFGLIILRKK